MIIYWKDINNKSIFCFNEYSANGILEAIDKYIKNNCKNVIFETMISRSYYSFKNYFDGKIIHLSISYKNNYNVKNLDRYDFVKNIYNLENIQSKIQSYIKEQTQSVINSKNSEVIKVSKKIEYSNENIDNEIFKVLYPLIYISKNTKLEDVYIKLNPDFTKNESGKTMKWLIKDFIESLNGLGIKNIVNER